MRGRRRSGGMTFLMQLSRYQADEVALETLCAVGVLCASENCVYKVAKVQEFTGNKPRSIKIKNSGCY